MSNPNHSEKSVYLDREEHDHRGSVGAKRVSLYTYDSGSDTLIPGTITSSKPLAVRLDDLTTANVTYVGKAEIASDPANPVWQISKIDETSGMVITWADGDADFDNIWNNRASLTYL